MDQFINERHTAYCILQLMPDSVQNLSHRSVIDERLRHIHIGWNASVSVTYQSSKV